MISDAISPGLPSIARSATEGRPFAIPPSDLDWLAAHVSPDDQRRARLMLHTLADIAAADHKLNAFRRCSSRVLSL